MQTYTTAASLRATVREHRQHGRTVAFVPTMGNLHEGHLCLMRRAQAMADRVVASIFVNPMQFGAHEDLASYPRTPKEDTELLVAEGVHHLFLPSVEEMYPGGLAAQARVSVPSLSDMLCGAERPGHFDGVATVVSKLFNMVDPDIAVFGNKDFQQLAIIRKLTRDLNFPIRIEGVDTARADDGLALSSRNGYLSQDERRRAPALYASLCVTRDAIANGQRDYPCLEQAGQEALRQAGFKPGYYRVCDAETLLPPAPECEEIVILASATMGNTRLIDNVTLALP
jgi:pantoate--beta-alanine ligase